MKKTKKVKEPKLVRGLCYRCEHRANYNERHSGKDVCVDRPRYECGLSTSVYSCYMYRPCVPHILEANAGDRRPLGGPAFIASRAHSAGLGEGEYIGRRFSSKRMLIYWKPKPDPELPQPKLRKARKK